MRNATRSGHEPGGADLLALVTVGGPGTYRMGVCSLGAIDRVLEGVVAVLRERHGLDESDAREYVSLWAHGRVEQKS